MQTHKTSAILVFFVLSFVELSFAPIPPRNPSFKGSHGLPGDSTSHEGLGFNRIPSQTSAVRVSRFTEHIYEPQSEEECSTKVTASPEEGEGNHNPSRRKKSTFRKILKACRRLSISSVKRPETSPLDPKPVKADKEFVKIRGVKVGSTAIMEGGLRKQTDDPQSGIIHSTIFEDSTQSHSRPNAQPSSDLQTAVIDHSHDSLRALSPSGSRVAAYTTPHSPIVPSRRRLNFGRLSSKHLPNENRQSSGDSPIQLPLGGPKSTESRFHTLQASYHDRFQDQALKPPSPGLPKDAKLPPSRNRVPNRLRKKAHYRNHG